MTQSMDRLDRLVEDYLGAVSYACAGLPEQRRDDLIADLREHIVAARAVLYQPTEAAVRNILDRLGEPAAIAEEARVTEGIEVAAPPPARSPAGTGRRRTPPVTLALVLWFLLTVITVLVLGAVLTMWAR